MKYAPYRKNEPLKPTKKDTFPKRLMFIDTETKPKDHNGKEWTNSFYLGSLIYVELDKNANTIKRNTYRFNSVYELLYIMAEYSHKKKRLLVFGHNISFDIEVLNLPMIYSDLGCESTYPIKNAMSFIWRVETGRGSIVFLDTANYSATSLEKLGKDIGIPKMSIDFETASDEYLWEYCLNDSEICEGFILQYIRFLIENNMGEFKQTIASQALTAFRHSFMTVQPVFHLVDSVNEIEKFSYFGGRTEALEIGHIKDDDLYYLDVSSEYPAAMIASKLPYQLIGVNYHPIRDAIDYHLENNYLIVKCDINTDSPVFPVRANIKRTKEHIQVNIQTDQTINDPSYKIIYPIGRYTTWLHQSEFIYALGQGVVENIHAYVVYKAADLFTDYVHTIFDLKAKYSSEGNMSFRLVSKLLANSLYGKWGQEYHDTQFIAEVNDKTVSVTYGYSAREKYTFTDVNWFGKIYRCYQTGLSTYSFPAIAGAITANARMILWKYRELAVDSNTFYSDTDSLITNFSGYSALKNYISKDKLGMLELKEKSDKLIIYGNKDYEFGASSTHKGIPTKAKYIGNWTWEYTNFEGFTVWRNQGGNRSPKASIISKTRKPIYDKGIVSENGRIIPYRLDYGQESVTIPLEQFLLAYAVLFPGLNLSDF